LRKGGKKREWEVSDVGKLRTRRQEGRVYWRKKVHAKNNNLRDEQADYVPVSTTM